MKYSKRISGSDVQLHAFFFNQFANSGFLEIFQKPPGSERCAARRRVTNQPRNLELWLGLASVVGVSVLVVAVRMGPDRLPSSIIIS